MIQSRALLFTSGPLLSVSVHSGGCYHVLIIYYVPGTVLISTFIDYPI